MDTLWTPAGELTAPPATPAKRPVMLGLTGKRNVGKSTAADYLESEYGFNRIHAFDGGKEAALAYFEYVTGDDTRAERMVFGELKDVPCADLPGGVAPRHFLERFGKFMGIDMGIDWTMAMEVRRARRLAPFAPIVAESLIYEADWFRANGGYIIRLIRLGHEGPKVESDAAQAEIDADITIASATVTDMCARLDEVVRRLGVA